MFHDTASALFGVAGLRVTDADPIPDGAVEVWAVSDCEGAAACPECGNGVVAGARGGRNLPADVRRGGDPVALNWVKKRLKCVNPACPRKTFTERIEALPPGCRVAPG